MFWKMIEYYDTRGTEFNWRKRKFSLCCDRGLIYLYFLVTELKNNLKKMQQYILHFIQRRQKTYFRKHGIMGRNGHNRKKTPIERVIFFGGSNLPSVRYRCVEVAEALGCDYILNVDSLEKIPANKDIFICVQPRLKVEHMELLSKRGTIVWDIHSGGFKNSFKQFIDYYLVETKAARIAFNDLKNVCVIPPHHMNFSNSFNSLDMCGEITWLGNEKFMHKFNDPRVVAYTYHNKRGNEIATIYRKTSIMVNMRCNPRENQFYIRVNPGIKLINCIGFGIPSISEPEPAYLEHAPECTIFSTLQDLPYWISRLEKDKQLYSRLRDNCIKSANKFSLKNVIKYYRNFILSL